MNTDIEREAREAALLSTPMGTRYDEDLCCYDNDSLRDEFVLGYLAAATLREEEIEGQRHFFNLATEEITTLRARVAELEMVVANYLPVCIGDCGCEGSLAGCAILGDDPEASAIAESVAAKMVPPPETKP